MFQDITSLKFEVIFIDDASQDQSLALLKELRIKSETMSKRNFTFRILRHASNCGQTMAILSGLAGAKGEAAIVMSADLQEDVKRIPDFIQRYQKGFEIVIGERITRDDPKVLSRLAYGLIRAKHHGFPKGGFDYYLISRRIYTQLSSFQHTKYRWLQTEIWNLKLKYASVPYHRFDRKFGKSTHTFSSRFLIFSIAVMENSPILIRGFLALGLVLLLFSSMTIGSLLVGYVGGKVVLPGYVTLFATLTLMGSIQILMLGSVGEYVWRIYNSKSTSANIVFRDEV